MIQDGGTFESLMHAILFAENPNTILFGRVGPDQGQDARSADGNVVYQAKFRQGLTMDVAIGLAKAELATIKTYRQSTHPNHQHWQNTRQWILVANMSINPNDVAKWRSEVVPVFQREGMAADFWSVEMLEGKLEAHAEIRDVFFGGENRVLIGLKEAHDLLSAECVASASFGLPLVGRDSELATIRNFAAATDKRVLPVVGPGGIGKSRLLYEGLVELAATGWRVLWALPGSMARSTQWFRLLNGTQQSCVVLDDPGDPGLLRAVVEQLAGVERRNWKVIVACRTERAEILRRFRTHALVDVPLVLSPLDEPASIALLNAGVGDEVQLAWAHGIYGLTGGIPGWICLIAELARRRALADLPATADEVANAYVESCIASLPENSHPETRVFLQWMSLWGALRLDAEDAESQELVFLGRQGLSVATARDLLSRLVASGLVRNWGVGKRLYAVEPLIVRQQILSQWLLRETAGQYSVSDAGRRLVEQLVAGEVPSPDAALQTLSHFARARMQEPEVILFMGPFFTAMSAAARDGDLLQQHRVTDLLQKAGGADPETALEVLAAIRRNAKESMTVEAPIWGPQTLTHPALVARLPWLLFQIAELVSDPLVARKFLAEFRELVALQDKNRLDAVSGQEPKQLLRRLLREARNAETYAPPACEIATAEIDRPASWPFVGMLAESLLNPIRESMDWVSNWTLSIGRRTLLPGSPHWDRLMTLRRTLFDTLRTCEDVGVRCGLWRVLAASHHDFHRAVLHEKLPGPAIVPYRTLLSHDLSAAVALLDNPPFPLSVEEVTQARDIWSWYLEYGRDQDLVDLARKCEHLYEAMSPWRFHAFFRFDTEEHLAPETSRVLAWMRAATDPQELLRFFTEADRYLRAVRHGREDMADYGRIAVLADGCADLFTAGPSTNRNAITAFVAAVLGRALPDCQLAWWFVARVCQKHLCLVKTTANQEAVTRCLDEMLRLAAAKGRLLYELYSNAHPRSTGPLSRSELEVILSNEAQFTLRERFILFGIFVMVDPAQVTACLFTQLEGIRENTTEAGACMACFVRSAYHASLRYDTTPTQMLVAWIVEMVRVYQLDGNLLGMHELEWLRDQMDFRLSLTQFAAFLRERVLLDGRPNPIDGFRAMPYDFDIGVWCRFNPTNQAERAALHELCGLATGEGFTALYWIPKYIARLDEAGELVAEYVVAQLAQNPEPDRRRLSRLAYLAAAYPDDSEAWARIAGPICVHARDFSREDREHVYFGLGRKETGVITSTPGQVADFHVQARDNAARLRDAEPLESPLRGYREWACRRTEADLLREQEQVEEDFHE
jgi:hypothetical protein